MSKDYTKSELFFTDRKTYLISVENELMNRLKKNRYRHTLGVAHCSANLAMRYGIEPDRAYLAGLLHDVAKHLTDEEMIKAARKYKIPVSDFEKNNPFILHGPVGAGIAMDEFNINDSDIINAISYHTVGRSKMSLLEKIVFVADYIEPSRDKAANLSLIRALAYEDIDMCVFRILSDTLDYLKRSGNPLDETTVKTYEYYKDLVTLNSKEEV